MKSKNFDYQSIKLFEKAKPNAKFKPEHCFKYYIKQTNNNKVRALEETFKYIDRYYAKYKKSDKMNAHEKYSYQEKLIDRLSKLDYESQVSFSVAYSVLTSLIISLYFAFLQISDSSGNNFFEELNNSIKAIVTIIIQSPNFIVKIVVAIFGLVYVVVTLGIISSPALGLIVLIKDNYTSTKYYTKFLKPYERKIIQEILMTYDSDYYFLK